MREKRLITVWSTSCCRDRTQLVVETTVAVRSETRSVGGPATVSAVGDDVGYGLATKLITL